MFLAEGIFVASAGGGEEAVSLPASRLACSFLPLFLFQAARCCSARRQRIPDLCGLATRRPVRAQVGTVHPVISQNHRLLRGTIYTIYSYVDKYKYMLITHHLGPCPSDPLGILGSVHG